MISSIEVGRKPVTYDVRAVNGDKYSPVLAQYKLIPGDYGFMLQSGQETSDDTRRNPDKYPDLYERIGYINFDRGDTILIGKLTPGKQYSGYWFS